MDTAGKSGRDFAKLVMASVPPTFCPTRLPSRGKTMKRARHNVEVLVERIKATGYRFRDVTHLPPSAHDIEMLEEIEREIGPLPISFRAFHEQVGSVDFCQSLDQLVQWCDASREEAS